MDNGNDQPACIPYLEISGENMTSPNGGLTRGFCIGSQKPLLKVMKKY